MPISASSAAVATAACSDADQPRAVALEAATDVVSPIRGWCEKASSQSLSAVAPQASSAACNTASCEKNGRRLTIAATHREDPQHARKSPDARSSESALSSSTERLT